MRKSVAYFENEPFLIKFFETICSELLQRVENIMGFSETMARDRNSLFVSKIRSHMLRQRFKSLNQMVSR